MLVHPYGATVDPHRDPIARSRLSVQTVPPKPYSDALARSIP